MTTATTAAHGSMQDWIRDIEQEFGGFALLGGEAGAQVMGAEIVATTAVVHVRTWDSEIMRKLRLLPSNGGRVTVRYTFGDVNYDPQRKHLADRMLVRAELMTLADERLDATRTLLRQQILARMTDEP